MDILAGTWAFFEATKYPLLFAGCYIEGTVVMMAAGLLWHHGVVAFWPAFAALWLGDFLADVMWYYIGYYAARKTLDKWGHHIGFSSENVAKVERRFHKYHTWILLISKLSMGFGLAVVTLTTAGMLRVPLYRYLLINGLGGLVWVLAMMYVGYYFGNVLSMVPTEYQVMLAVTVLVAAFFGLKKLSTKLAQSGW